MNEYNPDHRTQPERSERGSSPVNSKAYTIPYAFGMIVALASLMMSVSGCALMDLTNPKAPEISIKSIRPQEIGGTLQRMQVELLVKNPNRFSIYLQGLDFTAFVNDERLAKGGSDQAMTIPAVGESLVNVQLTLGLVDMLSQASKLFLQPEARPLLYRISGTVNLEGWPAPIPFNTNGEYNNPLQ